MQIEFEDGPSSYSTLYFVPHYISKHIEEKKENHPINTANHPDEHMNDPSPKTDTATLRSKHRVVHDDETVAFVALRDVLQINADQLAQLYNYNKGKYETFEAVINNTNTNYTNLFDDNEVIILYHFFSRVVDKDSWIEICNELGFARYFPSVYIDSLYHKIHNSELRAKGTELPQLRFFMQLLIFYSNNKGIDHHQIVLDMNDFTLFWMKSLSKIIKFISELAVGLNIEIYCALTQKWINATIIKLNKSDNQIYAQFRDGSNQHQWFSIYSPRLAPIGFKYFYIPNIMKRHNVPCIVSVIDEELTSMTLQNKPAARNISTTVAEIPCEGWFYTFGNDPHNKTGPVSISNVFIACVERIIDQNTPIHHNKFGTTTLKKLPHVMNAFRAHISKCKEHIDAQTNMQRTPSLSIFTTSSNTPASVLPSNPRIKNHNNSNVFIPETNVSNFRFNQR